MKTEQIKMMIASIIHEGSGVVYTDEGSGSGGPGFADAETLQDMLDIGAFDDATQVPMDFNLARSSFAHQCEFDRTTVWIQIAYSVRSLGYNQIAWICAV